MLKEGAHTSTTSKVHRSVYETFMSRTYLVHDDEVDSVLLRILVLAEPDAVALRIKALEVLHASSNVAVQTSLNLVCYAVCGYINKHTGAPMTKSPLSVWCTLEHSACTCNRYKRKTNRLHS